MKYLNQVIFLLIIGMAAMSEIHAKTDTSEYKKPYYTVQISYAGTGAEFRLNDIPFYLENFSGQVDVEIPVSDKIIEGINELTIIAFPFSDEHGPLENWPHKDARVEATLFVREKDSLTDTREMLTHLKLYPARSPDIAAIESSLIEGQDVPLLDYESQPRKFPNVTYDKQVVLSRKTDPITTPFPRWEWQDGVNLESTTEDYKSLLEAYRKEYLIHQKKDLVALKKSTRNLAETLMLVNYNNDIDEAYELLNLEESWKSNEQELFEFIEGESSKTLGLKLDIVASGKIARIVNESGIQPILYIVKKARMSIEYKFLFYKNKQGEWVYIM